jgi:hypothetical protein
MRHGEDAMVEAVKNSAIVRNCANDQLLEELMAQVSANETLIVIENELSISLHDQEVILSTIKNALKTGNYKSFNIGQMFTASATFLSLMRRVFTKLDENKKKIRTVVRDYEYSDLDKLISAMVVPKSPNASPEDIQKAAADQKFLTTSNAHRIRMTEDQKQAKRFILNLLEEESDRIEFERLFNALTTTEIEKSALKEICEDSPQQILKAIQRFSAKFAIDYVKTLKNKKSLTKFNHAYQFANGFSKRIRQWAANDIQNQINQISDKKQKEIAIQDKPINLLNTVKSELDQDKCCDVFNKWIKTSQSFKVGDFQTRDLVKATIEVVVGTDAEGRNKLIKQVQGLVMNLCFSSDTALIYHVIKHAFEEPFKSQEIGKEVVNIFEEINIYLQKAKQTVLQANPHHVKISYCQYENEKVVFRFFCEKLNLQTFISLTDGKAVINSCFTLTKG